MASEALTKSVRSNGFDYSQDEPLHQSVNHNNFSLNVLSPFEVQWFYMYHLL
jgi:hypothetical protein